MYVDNSFMPGVQWDIGKQYSPRCDATECSVPSGAILFAKRIFIKNLFENLKIFPMPLDNMIHTVKVDNSFMPGVQWDIGKRYSPRCDAAECSVPSGAILFAKRIFIKNLFENLKIFPMPLDNMIHTVKVQAVIFI